MNKHIFKLEEETNKVWNEETKSFEEFIELNKKENMEEREIKITLEQAKAMLEGGNEMLKKLALEVFPELNPISIIDKVKDYEDALVVLRRDHFDEKNLYPREIARRKLEIIIEALNEGWIPDFNDIKQSKWYCCFAWSRKGLEFAFVASYLSVAATNAILGGRLCLKDKKLADYTGEQFMALYEV
ncbi:MAG TPA: hypothetical protein VJ083_01455, partial [Sedimentibacter sp.]|nr:hypothetical protein [Sedimentibacter sp.]